MGTALGVQQECVCACMGHAGHSVCCAAVCVRGIKEGYCSVEQALGSQCKSCGKKLASSAKNPSGGWKWKFLRPFQHQTYVFPEGTH
eukprot:1161688-Pelagomonas_calceolata.AAC.2